jgi:hypothetical protein
MILREARCLFTFLLCDLILWGKAKGYDIAFDEVTEKITERDPTSDHMKNSLHHSGLAADLILYKNGTYLFKTEDYRELGEHWETIHNHCKWGGRFSDGNHFSFAPPELVGSKK